MSSTSTPRSALSAPACCATSWEEVENPHTQVSLEDAQKVRKSYKVGQRMVTPLKTKEFGRIAAQTAKHVIRQGLRVGGATYRAARCSPAPMRLNHRHRCFRRPRARQHSTGSGQGRLTVLPRNEQVPAAKASTRATPCRSISWDVLATGRGPRVTIRRTPSRPGQAHI